MNLYYQRDNITLYCGDNREIVPTLPASFFDFICTDPPYGLSFMGREWDHGVPGLSFWQTFLRVCKPGALVLAFGGTRTYHRLICAIEDAGWEIRDCLMWLYGQGFPKAADIGKMIDKAKGAVREVVGTKLGQPGYSLADHGRTNEVYGDLHNPAAECAVTAPVTDLAKAWTGWANAFKPAWEPITLAMKPLDGTLAHNAEQYGVAGLHIDAGRIACEGPSPAAERRASARKTGNAPLQTRALGVATAAEASAMGKIGYRGSAEVYGAERVSEALGRWPANLLLDQDAAASLDAQTGTLTSGKMAAGQQRKRSKDGGGYHGDFPDTASASGTYGDSGGASRFFYVAKAATSERNPPGMKNDHPTVKPLKLMEYLLTLMSTPTGGVILDPFAGSGSTLLAAKRLGRPCVGIELEEHNCKIAVARLEAL